MAVNEDDIDLSLDDPPVDVAHEVDEDAEQCLGKLIKDPWNDDKQGDWPNADLEPEVTS